MAKFHQIWSHWQKLMIIISENGCGPCINLPTYLQQLARTELLFLIVCLILITIVAKLRADIFSSVTRKIAKCL